MLDYRLLYLEHLTDRDLEALFRASQIEARPDERRARIGNRPELVDDLLASERLFDVVFGETTLEVRFTPFLVFGVIVHHAARDLQKAAFINEWAGPRQRLPVFDVDPLRHLLDGPGRRYFLTELLASFTKVASGSYWTRSRRGFHRRRFSELNPVQLVELAEGSPRWRRPGLYRRLGDVALFLTGVFPDHVGAQSFTAAETERLARSAGVDPAGVLEASYGPASEGGSLTVLEIVGSRWYQRAVGDSAMLAGTGSALLSDIASQFVDARRVLNYLTDRYLYRFETGYLPYPA